MAEVEAMHGLRREIPAIILLMSSLYTTGSEIGYAWQGRSCSTKQSGRVDERLLAIDTTPEGAAAPCNTVATWRGRCGCGNLPLHTCAMPRFDVLGPLPHDPELTRLYDMVPGETPLKALYRVHRDGLGHQHVRLVDGRLKFADPAEQALCAGLWRVVETRRKVQLMGKPPLGARQDLQRAGLKAIHRIATEGISSEQAVDKAIDHIKQILSE
jgi:hypothetical protein